MRVKLFFSSLAVVALLITSLLNPVGHAQEVSREVPTSGTTSAWEAVGFGSIETNITPQSYRLLQKGTSSIMHDGSGEVSAYAITNTKSAVGTVGASITLEQFTGGKWVTYRSLGSSSASNSSSVFHSASTKVALGYNYRVKATHWARDGSISEEDYSITSYIFVD